MGSRKETDTMTVLTVFLIVWAVGAIITFFVSTALMTEVYSYVIVVMWCILAWPVYLALNIVLAIRNP